mmetsp:Transcript_17900/g.34216  ORF Transcript_17900/g.34216 Transcript_17900/m.34216 type:complete len:134 (-) Transcript_17900:240-641(-)
MSSATGATAKPTDVWMIVPVGSKNPLDLMEELDRCVRALLPKSPAGDSPNLLKIMQRSQADTGEVEHHTKQLMMLAKQLEHYLTCLRAGENDVLESNQCTAGVLPDPTLLELHQEIAELESELREKVCPLYIL